MSMQMLTILQFIYMTAIYLGVMVVLPAIVFYPFFEGKSFGVKFLSYLTIGNFYVMNLVFLLQLLHISNKFTLIVGVAVPASVAIGYIHWNSWAKSALTFAGEATYGVLIKTMGVRLLLSKLFHSVVGTLCQKIKNVFIHILEHPIDTIGTFMVIVFLFWQYGTNFFENFGYTASDMPVHNYWINAMCDNHIFVAGVYPFGMHNIVYFLHEAFGMEVYTLLRVFGLLQTILIHMCLLIFLREVTKTQMAAYIAVSVYLIFDIWNEITFFRYLSSLPQEYGMIFILPSLLFLLRFMQERKSEGGMKGLKLDSTKEITLFAMNFSMTLAVHFYDTMIAGLFCVAAAIAFINVIFKKEYFWRILVFGVLSIAVAVFPMAFAYATGTPLQGSLRWGMSIMQSKNTESVLEQEYVAEDYEWKEDLPYKVLDSGFVLAQSVKEQLQEGQGLSLLSPVRTFGNPLRSAGMNALIVGDGLGLAQVVKQINQKNLIYVSEAVEDSFPGMFLCMTVILMVAGVLALLLKENEYGRIMISGGLFTFFLCVVMISKMLKIPALMDELRCSIYLAYSLVLVIGLLLDFLFYVGFAWLGENMLRQLAPVILFGIAVVIALQAGMIREPKRIEGLEKNGAIICVTNILQNEKENTYTILSANDELRMIEDHGYFYETIELLRNSQGSRVDDYLVIPTSKVFVFVEKIPGVYTEDYEGSGGKVTVASAMERLPVGFGINAYKGKNRHIVMSKLYFWAKAFKEMYENEMTVYYEDEEFICYEIRQNVNRPFDFSIDYGFNNAGLILE